MRFVSAERGRRLMLGVRVPPTIADCNRVGLDVLRWLEEGLVHIVVVGGGFISFETPVEEFVAAAAGSGAPRVRMHRGDPGQRRPQAPRPGPPLARGRRPRRLPLQLLYPLPRVEPPHRLRADRPGQAPAPRQALRAGDHRLRVRLLRPQQRLRPRPVADAVAGSAAAELRQRGTGSGAGDRRRSRRGAGGRRARPLPADPAVRRPGGGRLPLRPRQRPGVGLERGRGFPRRLGGAERGVPVLAELSRRAGGAARGGIERLVRGHHSTPAARRERDRGPPALGDPAPRSATSPWSASRSTSPSEGGNDDQPSAPRNPPRLPAGHPGRPGESQVPGGSRDGPHTGGGRCHRGNRLRGRGPPGVASLLCELPRRDADRYRPRAARPARAGRSRASCACTAPAARRRTSSRGSSWSTRRAGSCGDGAGSWPAADTRRSRSPSRGPWSAAPPRRHGRRRRSCWRRTAALTPASSPRKPCWRRAPWPHSPRSTAPASA